MPVYLDNNATTPLEPRVLDAMMPFLRDRHGNPSSLHRAGRLARAAIDTAREQVAGLVGARPEQVIFTSGGTEANNLALKGTVVAQQTNRLLIGATEHPSVSRPAEQMAKRGRSVTRLVADEQGRISPDQLDDMLGDGPAFVSVMTANNETGVIQDVARFSQKLRARDGVFHTDAVQAAGKIPIDFAACGAHLMSLSAHKLSGPKGAGALIVDTAIELDPLLAGGGQEKNRRSGTENVAGIVGFGTAALVATERLEREGNRQLDLRGRLESGLRALGGVVIFSERVERLPNTVCFSAEGIEGGTLVMALDKAGMAVSSGSACGSGKSEPNPVLAAMGISQELARGSVRISLGTNNHDADIDAFLAALGGQLHRLRGLTRRACA